MPVYKVIDASFPGELAIISADNVNQAMRAIMSHRYKFVALNPREVMDAFAQGAKVLPTIEEDIPK